MSKNKTSRKIKENSQAEKTMVFWAAGTLTKYGCTLHSVDEAGFQGWDIETPTGWQSASNARELVAVANDILRQRGL